MRLATIVIRATRLLTSLWVILLLLASSAGANCNNPLDEEGSIALKLNAFELLIPERYSTEPAYLTWFRWIPGLDNDSRSALVLIPDEDVACAIPGYRFEHNSPFKEDMLLLIQALSDTEKREFANPEYAMISSIRLGIGPFSGGKVVKEDRIPGAYKYFEDETEKRWVLLRLAPDEPLPVGESYFDYFISDCQKSGPAYRIVDSCTSVQIVGDFSVEFSYTGHNLVHLAKMRKLTEDLIGKWRRHSQD